VRIGWTWQGEDQIGRLGRTQVGEVLDCPEFIGSLAAQDWRPGTIAGTIRLRACGNFLWLWDFGMG